MLGRILGLVAATFLTLSIALVPQSALAAGAGANGCVLNGVGQWVCTNEGGTPGTPPEGGSGTEPASFTPGPSECAWTSPDKTKTEPEIVECTNGDGGWWSNGGQCYWVIVDPQAAPPPNQSASVGAWYRCSPICDLDFMAPGECVSTSQWLNSPPPGVYWYTPSQAAAALAATLTLSPIPIGMAPAEKVHSDDPAGTAPYRRTWVGIPVWAWVDNPTTDQWGAQTVTDTIGGVTITLTAATTGLWWDTGDGQQIVCSTGGTAFDITYWANKPAQDSPDCGWRFTKTGSYTVTAISAWSVEWIGGGESGQILMPSTSTTTTVQVGELQSVNVTPEG